MPAGTVCRRRTSIGPETRPLLRALPRNGNDGRAGDADAMYNSTLQIVQSPQSVMILVEMVHHARVIPIVANAAAARHGPDVIPQWAGDSVGWYQGDTLVVETRNVHPLQPSLISKVGKVTERFSRWADGQILYEFSVDDPTLYTQVWKGEMALNASKPIYEMPAMKETSRCPGIWAAHANSNRVASRRQWGRGLRQALCGRATGRRSEGSDE